MKLKLRYHAIKCLLSIDDDFNREFVFTECVVSALKIIARARVVSTDSLTDMAPYLSFQVDIELYEVRGSVE